MAGIQALREVDGRGTAIESVDAPFVTPSAPAVPTDGIDMQGRGRLLPVGEGLSEVHVTGALLAQAAVGPNVDSMRNVLRRYRAMVAALGDGTPSALMAASWNDRDRAVAAYGEYLAGQRVGVPQAALLTATGVERNVDIGTALAAYRSFVRYDRVSPNAAAMLAIAQVRTGTDIDAVYRRYSRFLDSGRSQTAAAALAAAEIESGDLDSFNGLSQRLRSSGFQADDDAIIASAMLRHGRSNTVVASLHNTHFKDRGVPPSVRASLVAAGVASDRSSSQMFAAYDWFHRNGEVPEAHAVMLAASWAMPAGDGAGVMTTIALRNSDMRDD
ncbi:MAG: hypothetical protein ACAI38_16640 [Myxococcota bacterium]|nr:hypothetical protein [Myxococcota bacterium]